MARLLEKIYEGYLEDPGSLEDDLFNALALSPETLLRAQSSQSSVFAHWAILTSIADTHYRRHTRFITTYVWPEVMRAARIQLRNSGIRESEDKAKEIAYANPMYVKAVEAQTKYGHVLDILKKAESSLWQRKSMIDAMSYRSRKEENSAPRGANGSHVAFQQPNELSEHISESLEKPKRTVEELESLALQTIRRNRSGS